MVEEVGTKACIVGRIVKKEPDEMGWTHGLNERRDTTEKTWDKETRRLQKTRKTTAKMGGLCEDRSEKGRGGRHLERKCQQQRAMEKLQKYSRVTTDQLHPYKRETSGGTRTEDNSPQRSLRARPLSDSGQTVAALLVVPGVGSLVSVPSHACTWAGATRSLCLCYSSPVDPTHSVGRRADFF